MLETEGDIEPKDFLKEFFAVTLTSIYRVIVTEDHRPLATKIALKGESFVPVGEILKDGDMLAITTQLVMYIPEGHGMLSPITSFERRIEGVNTMYWGGHTSPIIALFKTEEEAQVCFDADIADICDSRFDAATREVCDAIGDDHPVFYVCKSPEFCLRIFKEKK